MRLKVESARRQLGTALALYLMDHNPISVHCLAGGGCEVIEFYAQKLGKEPFTTSILRDNPHLDDARLRHLQRQHWTAFKHATRHVGTARGLAEERDDEDLLASFSDEQNDLPLMIGWADYANVTGQMPIEAQVQQVWWIAQNLNKLNPERDTEPYRNLFPDVTSLPRAERKQRLREMIDRARSTMPEVLQAAGTEPRPLIMPWVS